MKKIFALIVSCSFPFLAGCVYVGVTQPSAYNAAYQQPYGAVVVVDAGHQHASPVHAAKKHGPTPFEAVFGKGALRQPHHGGDRRR